MLGCSSHPLPEDVSRVSTFDIVERIRCEIHEGLVHFSGADRHAQKIINGTVIGFEFEFVMTELNSASEGKLEFERPAFKGMTKFEIDIRAAASSKRKNSRVFRTLEDLKAIKEADCSREATRANWRYPIAGATGMAEIVRTYIRLEKLTDLERGDEGRVFADEIDFTTEFNVGALPDLTVDTVAGSLRITKASISGTAKRHDVHSVTVGLARDPLHADVDLPAVRRDPRMAAAKERRQLVERDVAQRSRPLRQVARDNTDARNRILLELQRRRNVKEDARVVAKVLTGALP